MKELSKIYEPHEVEDRWIDVWLQNKAFTPRKTQGPAYSIVIPPPNVTGSLHMGHALNSTVQDILARYHRMKGDNVLWVVGTDHAGIATQNVVERQLQAEGKSRFDLGREKFVERVWKWRYESGGTIISQLKRLGASCDYDNERFTMDEGLSAAVLKVFVQLYNEGLIYRGLRLINWCPRCHTALSDLEVEHESRKGSLWHIRYPHAEKKNEYLIVATTRPETLLGDTAVAVNPEDERYKNWVGKKVLLPLTNRQIPVLADAYVDQTFGSGVVKITPAHDFNDFAVAERHGLEKINILTADGKINEAGGSYQGLSVSEARKKVIEDLTAQELLEKEEPYQNSVGTCYRCKTVVEPYLSHQWFVKAKPLAEKAIDAVKSGQTQFIPQHWEKTYFNWMENIQDWCISRQIWWGHQIPAWYGPDGTIFVAENVDKAQEQAIKHYGSSVLLTRDEDVLDTWFSSGLWPFSTLGWPQETEALKAFYPTSVLVTAFDIIFFWVARMMMLGIHFMKQVPFRHVHIHALVRDPMGQKMSKSKGNVVDPLLMMTKYGTDAFRFTLAAFAAQGRDIKLDEARIEGYRNFCNKIWNASRFALMSAAPHIQSEEDFQAVRPFDRINQWILAELSAAILKTIRSIEEYEFNQGALAIYTFFWHSFCDWYLEFTKEVYRQGSDLEKVETAKTTYFVLDTSLRLLHPFMPFITEEIWQFLADRKGKTIALSEYPAPLIDAPNYSQSWTEIRLVIDTVVAIRGIRQETGVPLSEKVNVKIMATKDSLPVYQQIEPLILTLGKILKMDLVVEEPAEPAAVAMAGGNLIAVPLQGLIDVDKEHTRQLKKLEKLDKDMKSVRAQLENPNFISNADPELVAEKKELLASLEEQKDAIDRAIRMLRLG